jgi:1-acyl-sn-glycerol-3-phosphate acyltransferase
MISLTFILIGLNKKDDMKIGIIARSLFSRLLLVLISIIFLIPIFIFMCIPERFRYSSTFIFRPVYWFYCAILKCSLVPITYKGIENIPDEPVIFAANHQSSLDIPLLGVLSKTTPHVWLAKKELMDSVFVRFVVPLIAVLVNVDSPREAMLSLRKILTIVNNHYRNLMIFPEGGRYTDGAIHDFFGGFVILAKKTGRPVVPVYINGVNKVYPPDSFLVYWFPITVTVGKPITLKENETDEQFKNRVYEWFVDQMRQAE